MASLPPASTAGSLVQANSLTRRFGPVTALDHVTLTIRRGEYFSLLGPSGCGKTTFLRTVAGLDTPDDGSLFIAGRSSAHFPAHQRPVNTVFQSYALFPHLNVRQNVAFGLHMKRVPNAEITRRVGEVLELVRISEFADRNPRQLSGGQKQRVALARAIVNEPEVLLLDEPLAALDVTLRRELQSELHRLQRRLGMTFIHVTHDQDEALSLSDRSAVMRSGRVVQAGTARDIYDRPRDRFTAQFVGGCNILACAQVVSNRAQTALGEIEFPEAAGRIPASLAIRPERILVGSSAGSINRFQATIEHMTYTGPETQLQLRAGNELLKATVLNTGARTLQTGITIPFNLPPESLMALED